ncbi:MAG: hypothetical protein AAGC60_14250 [Acidobacteriota bacterium]
MLLLTATAAAPTPSPQIQVNTFTDGLQRCPHVAPSSSGFVVVWESNLGDTVRMRFLDPAGAPLGEAITVSDVQTPVPNSSSGCWAAPRVVQLSDGGHVVTWWQQDSQTARGKRFFADGTPAAESFDLNAERAVRPSALSGGGFVIVYMIGGIAVPAEQEIAAQIFANDGTPVVAEFLVNDLTTGAQRLPSVASTPNGGFIAVWESRFSLGDDDDNFSIQARRFDSLGMPLDGQFQVNEIITGRQQRADLGVGPTGEFIVVWDSISSAGDDQSSFSIQRRHFASDGTPLGGQAQVNRTTANWQTLAHVAIASTGEAQIVWESLTSTGNDPSCRSLLTRRFAADGSALDPEEQQVERFWEGAQRWVQVALLPTDDLLVVWMSQSSGGSDVDSYSVQARLMPPSGALFSDDFESGNLDAWLFDSSLQCDRSSTIGF